MHPAENHAPRLARHRSAAGIARAERKYINSSTRAAYSARAARRADRQATRASLRTLTR